MLLDVTDREMTHYRILAINTEGITAQIPKCCATPEVVVYHWHKQISLYLDNSVPTLVCAVPPQMGVLQKSTGHRQTFFVPPHFQFISSTTAVNST